ncbi:MAG: adenylosuccinate lyase [Saprospiraceae bacterium]|nr:adenylosuccinate lyase [Saprospiraceae bacterium]
MIRAISPLDGRYSDKLRELGNYFSEFALIKYRLKVEMAYLKRLIQTEVIPAKANNAQFNLLNEIVLEFNEEKATQVKEIEKKTNHDVKALEYFIKEQLNKIGLNQICEFVHFALTSQDINNTATPMILKDFTSQILLPRLKSLNATIRDNGNQWIGQAMLSRTHGQAATPTTMGKEWLVFAERLENQIMQLERFKFSGKFGGATGNFNAHCAAYPNINWPEWADSFLLEDLELYRQKYTTQIAHYDEISEWFHMLIRIQTLLLDFCRDIWAYISLDYFKQKIKAGEIGSSTMPHKVNPIDFENAEGNLGLATAIGSHLAEKLPVSRLQRDLSDSTVLRNVGVPCGHLYLALLSIEKGISKLILNEDKLWSDLDHHWIILAEPIQTILRRENYPQPYEALKELTRVNSSITKEILHDFIHQLQISDQVKAELLALSPHNYLGTLGKT